MALNGEEKRPSWGRHIEFVITCIGFAVGLGNVWRFPHLVYTNGGGAFLIPYVVSLVFMGIPLFCIEILFGQFANLGPISIWEINPMFKGLGITMCFLSGIIAVYYNVVVATAIYFLFASMQGTLPWTTCGNEWNTCACRTNGMNQTLQDPTLWFNDTGLNCTGVNITVDQRKSPSEEYYYNQVLDRTDGIDEPGYLKWDLTLCNLLAWGIICACLIKGVKSLGKAVYFFALFPYVLLTVLLVRGLTLEGSSKGVDFYLNADTSKLTSSSVWKDAASQIFFSLSCCTGSLTAMASYNKFNNNFVRDSLIIPIINCLTSFFAGFAIFSVLGFMAETSGKSVHNVTTDGPGLIFVAYPEALGEMPVPQLWSVLFFLMLMCLGFGSQFPSVETVITSLQDEYPTLRSNKWSFLLRVSICTLGFLLGLPQTTTGGYYLMDLCDLFVGFPLLLVGLLEFVVIVWIYGFGRLLEDILLMVGYSKITRKIFYGYFSWNFVFFAPVFILAIIVFECVQYTPITGDHYPAWSEALGWLLVVFIMMWVPVFFIGNFLWKGGARLLINLNQPTIKWGPTNPEHRTLPRYQFLLSHTSTGLEKNTGRSEDAHDFYPKANQSTSGVYNEAFEDKGESMPPPLEYDECKVEMTAM